MLTFLQTQASSPSLWGIIMFRMGEKQSYLLIPIHEAAHGQMQDLVVGPQRLFHMGNWKMSAPSSCDSILGQPSVKLMACSDADWVGFRTACLGASHTPQQATHCCQLCHKAWQLGQACQLLAIWPAQCLPLLCIPSVSWQWQCGAMGTLYVLPHFTEWKGNPVCTSHLCLPLC